MNSALPAPVQIGVIAAEQLRTVLAEVTGAAIRRSWWT
jgi:hypothetical protein